jgi:hypothetical protein
MSTKPKSRRVPCGADARSSARRRHSSAARSGRFATDSSFASTEKRDLALFNLAIDSKSRLRSVEPARGDIIHENHVSSRAVAMPRKTRRRVRFKIAQMSREAEQAWTRATGYEAWT